VLPPAKKKKVTKKKKAGLGTVHGGNPSKGNVNKDLAGGILGGGGGRKKNHSAHSREHSLENLQTGNTSNRAEGIGFPGDGDQIAPGETGGGGGDPPRFFPIPRGGGRRVRGTASMGGSAAKNQGQSTTQSQPSKRKRNRKRLNPRKKFTVRKMSPLGERFCPPW